MKQDKTSSLLNGLKHTFNPAATYVGNAIAWGGPAALLLIYTALYALTGEAQNMETNTVMIAGGASAIGLGLAALGYSRTFAKDEDKSEDLKRGMLAHSFNFAASSLGAAISSISALLLTNQLLSNSSLGATELSLFGASQTVGLLTFAAGYTRFFGSGKTKKAFQSMLGESDSLNPPSSPGPQ